MSSPIELQTRGYPPKIGDGELLESSNESPDLVNINQNMAGGDNSINPTGNASMSSVHRRLDTRFGEMSVRALTVV